MKLKKQPISEKLGLISRTKWNAQSVSVMIWRLPGTQYGLFSSVLPRTKLLTSELLGKGAFKVYHCVSIKLFSSPVDIRKCWPNPLTLGTTTEAGVSSGVPSRPVEALPSPHLCLHSHFLKLCLRKALCSTTSQNNLCLGRYCLKQHG